MADVEERARIIVQAENKGFQETEARIARLEGEIAALTAKYKSGGVGYDEYTEKGTRLQAELDSLRAAHDKASEAVKRYGSTQAALAKLTEQSQSKMAGFGQSMLQTGRIVQDFQAAGLRGILNNLEGLSLALGGGAGLAGAVTVAAVAFEVFKPQIKAAWDALASGRPREAASQIETLTKRIEELKGQHVTLAVDRSELERAETQLGRLKRAQDEFRAAQGRQTSAEAEAGKAAQEAITEEGEPELVEALRAKFVREQTKKSVPLREAQERQQALEKERDERRNRFGGLGLAGEQSFARRIAIEQDRARAARDAINKEAETHVGGLLTDLREKGGQAQATARTSLARELEGIGRGQLATQIRGTTPEAIRAQEQADVELEQSIEDMKDARQRNKDLHRKQDEETKKRLDKFVGSNEAEKRAMEVTLQAEKKGADAETTFEEVRRQIQDAILTKLREQGRIVDRETVQEQAYAAAQALAAKAFDKSGAAQRAVAKADARAEAKEDRTEFGAAKKDLDAEVRQTAARAKAEAGRMVEQLDTIRQQMGQVGIVEAFRMMARTEEQAKQLATQIALTLRQSGGTRTGSLEAGTDIARQAGFVVTEDDIRAMSGKLNPRANVAGPGGFRSVAPGEGGAPLGSPAQAAAVMAQMFGQQPQGEARGEPMGAGVDAGAGVAWAWPGAGPELPPIWLGTAPGAGQGRGRGGNSIADQERRRQDARDKRIAAQSRRKEPRLAKQTRLNARLASIPRNRRNTTIKPVNPARRQAQEARQQAAIDRETVAANRREELRPGSDKAEDAAAQARKFARENAPNIGVQALPDDELKQIGDRSVELQRKGVEANEATLQAMQEAVQAMVSLANRSGQQVNWARQMGRQFSQVSSRVDDGGQPGALNYGYMAGGS